MIIRWLRTLHTDLNLNGLRTAARPRRGQSMIMFALLAVPMIGMLGLVVDTGFYLYARRTTQAAADAAAMAGARQLSKSIDAQADVVTVAGVNAHGDIQPVVARCAYVNDSNTRFPGTTCGAAPSGASGVNVRAETTVPTFFLSVIPGAPTSVPVAAEATARVQIASGLTAGAPFLVCGFGSWDVTSDPDTTNGGTTTSILSDDDPATINPDAIGQTFRIWDSRLVQEGAGCDSNSRFKGLANSEANEDLTLPNWLEIDYGTRAGPTRTNVNGPGGCAYGATEFNDCVLILPIVTDNAPSGGASNELYGVGFAAFRMTPIGSNSYNGTLLDAYILDGPGANGWTPELGGPISVRLAG